MICYLFFEDDAYALGSKVQGCGFKVLGSKVQGSRFGVIWFWILIRCHPADYGAVNVSDCGFKRIINVVLYVKA